MKSAYHNETCRKRNCNIHQNTINEEEYFKQEKWNRADKFYTNSNFMKKNCTILQVNTLTIIVATNNVFLVFKNNLLASVIIPY